MSKQTRQQMILDIVGRQRVGSQAVLAEELKRAGIEVTQATLSRDIAELALVKAKDGYLRPEDARGNRSQVLDPVGTLRRLVLKVDEAMNLVVVRVSPGSAELVGVILDDGSHDQIVGTLAGDDTVLVVCRDPQDALFVKAELLSRLS